MTIPSIDSDYFVYSDACTQLYYVLERVSNTVTTSTDATDVIQYALSRGGKIRIASGDYVINKTLMINKDDIILEGSGFNTKLLYNCNSLFSMADKQQRTGIQFKSFKAHANNYGFGTCFDMRYFAICKIQDVNIEFANVCIDFHDLTSLYNYIENVWLSPRGQDSIGIALRNKANENTIIRTRINPDNNLSIGILVDAHSNGLYSVNVEKNALIGIDIGPNGHETSIYDVYLEHNYTNLRIASGVQCPILMGGNIADGQIANIADNGAVKPKIMCRLQYRPYCFD
jgi:hypothetical protein